MRGTRWLLLLAILAILGGVGATYRLQRKILESQAPAKPARMPANLKAPAEDWIWSQKNGSQSNVTVSAHSFRQEKDSGLTELEEVKLKILSKDGDTYDIVKCAHAQFTQGERRL